MKSFLRWPSAAAAALFALMLAAKAPRPAEAFSTPGSLRPFKGRENSFLFSATATAAASKTQEKQTAAASKTTKKRRRRPKGGENAATEPGKKSAGTKKKKKKPVAKKSSKKKKPARRDFKPLKDLKLGSTVNGTVVDVCEFGAFVWIGYATRGSREGAALLHASQIQNERIDDVSSLYKAGDRVENARVITVDHEKGEVGLSLRPRRKARRDLSSFGVGDVVEGKVKSVVEYGAFVDVGATVNALLHVSRITGGAVDNIRRHVNEGDAVSAHVIDVDVKGKRMAVSLLNRKADLYHDKRRSQRLKRSYGTASVNGAGEGSGKSEVDYFDKTIKDLEDALK